MDKITATRLQRDTRKLLDAVQHRGVPFEIQRHGEPAAFLVPAGRDLPADWFDLEVCTGDEAVRLIFDDEDPRGVTP